MTKYVIDTNVLIDNPFICDDLDGEVIISFVTLQELDHLKNKVYGAREALRQIEKCGNIIVDRTYEIETNDDKILETAINNNAILLTNDYGLRDKAKVVGHPYQSIGETEQYTGYKEVILTDVEMAKVYENLTENRFNLLQNQYLLLKDENGELKETRVWRNGSLEKIKLPKIKGFKCRNPLQACALDLLNNDDVPNKILCGSWGSGKTMMSMYVALHKILEQGKYQKLLMIRSPYIDKDSQIGFLPGDKKEKMAGFLRSLEQYIDGGERTIISLEQREMIDFDVPNTEMKGLTISDTLILVDESEDLTYRQLKLLGSRVGEKSSIVFTGDWEQAEDKFRTNNPLRDATNKLKGDPLVGILVLEKDERSKASQVFMKL